MVSQVNRSARRRRVHARIRKRLRGTAARPRLAVFRSLRHIYAQVIDDDAQHTLVTASSVGAGFAAYGGNVAAATKVGEMIAERVRESGIERLVFDRGGHNFKGRVRAVAEAVQKAGLLPPTRERLAREDPAAAGRER
ncbi:MAG: 50S ribosomal protein L18 [Bryobacterales bacterium]|nr:50S ribosomal protein L18 [Bryobacterales bacterium]